jgi:hypothetical protein
MSASSRTEGQTMVDKLLVHRVDHLFCVSGESYWRSSIDTRRLNAVTICRRRAALPRLHIASKSCGVVEASVVRPGVLSRRPAVA